MGECIFVAVRRKEHITCDGGVEEEIIAKEKRDPGFLCFSLRFRSHNKFPVTKEMGVIALYRRLCLPKLVSKLTVFIVG